MNKKARMIRRARHGRVKMSGATAKDAATPQWRHIDSREG
jgi:hypothetical protein